MRWEGGRKNLEDLLRGMEGLGTKGSSGEVIAGDDCGWEGSGVVAAKHHSWDMAKQHQGQSQVRCLKLN